MTAESPDAAGPRHVDRFDVAVVGCGMAGLAAAIRAAETGASVVVLEKAPESRRGGQTQYTESFRIPTAAVDLDLDFHRPDYAPEDFYRDVMAVTEGFSGPEPFTSSIGSPFREQRTFLHHRADARVCHSPSAR